MSETVVRAALAAAIALTAAAAAGCGGTGGAAGDRAAAAPGAHGLPEAVRARGVLRVATDATYPPNEFLAADGRTIRGMSADLAAALERRLGIRVQLVNAPFDGILPGLAGGKFDLGISSFTDTRERERAVDFVTYFSAGTSFVVRAADGPPIERLADLCGHTAAVQKGTVQADDARAQDRRCRAAGRAPVGVLVLPDQAAANLALAAGRADVTMADSPVAAYAVQRAGGRFALAGEPYGTAPYGIAIPKGTGMTEPVLHAVRELMRDGSYARILRRWGLQDGAIERPEVNGAAG